MKTNSKYLAVALLALGGIFTSCEKSELEPATIDKTASLTETGDREAERSSRFLGKWNMARYIENGKDQSHLFEGFVLEFQLGGNMVAYRGNEVVKGLWSRGPDNSNNSNRKLYLDFGLNMPFGGLSEPWYILEFKNDKAQLRTSYDPETDYLTLVRELQD